MSTPQQMIDRLINEDSNPIKDELIELATNARQIAEYASVLQDKLQRNKIDEILVKQIVRASKHVAEAIYALELDK